MASLCGCLSDSLGPAARQTACRLNRGGNRQAMRLLRVAIVRMRDDEKTENLVTRRTAEGKTRREIVRCIQALMRARDLSAIFACHRSAS